MTSQFIQTYFNSSGGSDVTPSAVNWGDISKTGTSGFENNSGSAVTLAAIDLPITLKATWTSVSAHPAWGYWVKNGIVANAAAPSPVSVTASVNDVLYFVVYCAHTFPQGNYDTGTVTVTNTSDSNATLDTFTYEVQYVFVAGGGYRPGDEWTYGDGTEIPVPGNKNVN